MKNFRRIVLFILAMYITAFASSAYSAIQEDAPYLNTADWSSDESNFFIIYYLKTADLRAVERKISVKALSLGQTASYNEVNPPKEICQRLDSMFDEVKNVLGMHPEMPRIKIVIFKDKDELNKEYFKIFGAESDLKSFYVNNHNAIYTSESAIEDSVMIHEMAHAVIDHYFSVIPPKIISEVLASYVDVYFGK